MSSDEESDPELNIPDCVTEAKSHQHFVGNTCFMISKTQCLHNTPENQGPIPPKHQFDPDSTSNKDRDNFFKWYEEQEEKGEVYNLLEELYAYCRSDVEVLHRCCAKFKSLFVDTCNLDPFQHQLAIRSTVRIF